MGFSRKSRFKVHFAPRKGVGSADIKIQGKKYLVHTERFTELGKLNFPMLVWL